MFDSLQPIAYSLQPAACPEDRLILLLCRGRVSADQEAEARELLRQPSASVRNPQSEIRNPQLGSPQPTAHSPQPHWSRIIARALEQEILPLFRRNLETLGFPGVPADARARMNDLCRANTARQLLLVEELRRLLGLLDSAGIPAIPLKGPWLAQRLYGDYTLRVCADLDLLVPPDRAVDAARVLTADGYEGCFPLDFFARHLVPGSMDYCLSKRGSLRCAVELHWRLLRGGESDRRATDDLWKEARPCTTLGAPAYCLTPEWELLFLSLHAATHQWQGLKWLADIDQICSAQRIDWEAAKAKADGLALTPVVERTLGACHKLFGTAVPKPFAARPLPAGVRLFPAPASAFSALRGAMIHYRLLPGVWEKLRCLAEASFVPNLTDHDLILLPSSLSFLYYLVRPFRLTCKWAWRSLQAMVSRDWRLELGLRSGQARSAFASAWQLLAVKVHDLAAYCLRPTAYCLQPTAYWCPRGVLLYLLIGLLCILSLRAAFNTAAVSLVVQVRPEARLDQDAFSFDLTIGLPAGPQVRL